MNDLEAEYHGSPRKSWTNILEEDLRNMEVENWKNVVQSRDK